jgi:hypothetical protein
MKRKKTENKESADSVDKVAETQMQRNATQLNARTMRAAQVRSHIFVRKLVTH